MLLTQLSFFCPLSLWPSFTLTNFTPIFSLSDSLAYPFPRLLLFLFPPSPLPAFLLPSPSLSLCICLCLCLCLSLSLSLSLRVSLSLSLSPSLGLSLSLSLYLSIYLSIYLPIFLFLFSLSPSLSRSLSLPLSLSLSRSIIISLFLSSERAIAVRLFERLATTGGTNKSHGGRSLRRSLSESSATQLRQENQKHPSRYVLWRNLSVVFKNNKKIDHIRSRLKIDNSCSVLKKPCWQKPSIDSFFLRKVSQRQESFYKLSWQWTVFCEGCE